MFEILVIDDDKNTRILMNAILLGAGYTPVLAEDGEKALEIYNTHHVDMVIADIMMPNLDGYEFTKILRKSNQDIPIIMVSAKELPDDRKKGFKAGIDDYLVKPVDEEELLLHIKAIERRLKIAGDRKITIGSVVLDYDSFTVNVNGEEILLPQKEFKLLYLLLSNPGRIYTRIQLMDEIWGTDTDTGWETVTVHIGRLRKRFENIKEFEIVSVRGIKAYMKKKLVLISSFIVFLIQTVSMLIVGTISTILIHSGIITINGSSKTRVIMVICCILGASILIGFIVSIIFTRIPVKPLDELIKGMDRLADGDYSVRIKFNKNPGLKKVEHSFNKMAEELQNTELLSSNFINDFSHEFKTPLVSILGFTKLLRKNILTDEEREEYLGIIEEEMKRLYTMANGILNLTKVENQSILTNVTKYNLSEQIRLAVLLLESKWTAKNINMNIDFGEYTINANEEMMKQVWINLLDNAIKFSPCISSCCHSIYPEIISTCRHFMESRNFCKQIFLYLVHITLPPFSYMILLHYRCQAELATSHVRLKLPLCHQQLL